MKYVLIEKPIFSNDEILIEKLMNEIITDENDSRIINIIPTRDN